MALEGARKIRNIAQTKFVNDQRNEAFVKAIENAITGASSAGKFNIIHPEPNQKAAQEHAIFLWSLGYSCEVSVTSPWTIAISWDTPK